MKRMGFKGDQPFVAVTYGKQNGIRLVLDLRINEWRR
jgi:hypothetical protein